MGSQSRHPSRDGVEKELRREFVKKPLVNNKWGRLLEFESFIQNMLKHGLLIVHAFLFISIYFIRILKMKWDKKLRIS